MSKMSRLTAAALACVALLAGCSSEGDDQQYTHEQAKAAGAKHVTAAIGVLPDLVTKPLGEQRGAFESAAKGAGMSVTWGKTAAVLSDRKNRCASTYDLKTSDMAVLECGGVTFKESELETVLISALVPAPTPK